MGNIQLTRIMGGDVRIDPAGFDIGVRDSWKRALQSVIDAGGTPYPIPAGASDHPLGGLGFANWAVEVEAQEAERNTFFDTIIVCTVTGSSHAEGKSMAGLIGMIRSGEIPAGSKVLYCHLGGQPALPAYAGFPGLGSPERELSH